MVALWEHALHGNLAAPIVRDVLKAYLDKQIRRQITERRVAPPPPVDSGQPELPEAPPDTAPPPPVTTGAALRQGEM